MTNSLYCSQA